MSKSEKEIVGLVDLHAHLAVHLPFWFMLFGGDPEKASSPKLTYSHAHHQHMNVDLLKKSGVKIYVQAALVNSFGCSKAKAEKQVLEQLEYVENVAKRHANDFAVAHTPEEARSIIAQGKMALIHALEGAEFLIDSVDDARFWRKRGVAMIAPIHLTDNEYGDASIMSGIKAVVNWKGWLKRAFWPSSRHGLTVLGKVAINNLLKAGIIIDTAHMSEQSLDQTLGLTATAKMPTIMSHGFVRQIRQEERGLTDRQIKSIYDLGGMLAITAGLPMLHPHGPLTPPVSSDHCQGSVDDYLLHVQHLEKLLGVNTQPMALGTDFNGFVAHLRPKCGAALTDFDRQGLAGPHLIPSMMDYLKNKNVGVESYNRSAERFLQIWEQAVVHADA